VVVSFFVLVVSVFILTDPVAYTLPKEIAANATMVINFFIFDVFCFKYDKVCNIMVPKSELIVNAFIFNWLRLNMNMKDCGITLHNAEICNRQPHHKTGGIMSSGYSS